MKVPNASACTISWAISLSRLQNEGSQLGGQGEGADSKSIKATE